MRQILPVIDRKEYEDILNGFHNISCIWSMKLYGIEGFCGHFSLKIGMLQVWGATNMTLNTMFWSFMSHQTYWLFRDKPTGIIEGSQKVKSPHAMLIKNLNVSSWLQNISWGMHYRQQPCRGLSIKTMTAPHLIFEKGDKGGTMLNVKHESWKVQQLVGNRFVWTALIFFIMLDFHMKSGLNFIT